MTQAFASGEKVLVLHKQERVFVLVKRVLNHVVGLNTRGEIPV